MISGFYPSCPEHIFTCDVTFILSTNVVDIASMPKKRNKFSGTRVKLPLPPSYVGVRKLSRSKAYAFFSLLREKLYIPKHLSAMGILLNWHSATGNGYALKDILQ